MKGLKLDFKKIAVETAGNALGLVAVTQVNRIGFIKNISKPVLKGALMIAIGKIGFPYLAGHLLGKGKGNSAGLVTGASEAISTYGVAQIMSNIDATKNLVPAISGYEDSPYLGSVYEQEKVNGYGEEESVNGNNDVYIDS